MNLPEYIIKIMDKFEHSGYQSYVVGGCVRDALLHREPNDYDMTTNAFPEDIERLFTHTIPTGKKHGTITVCMDGHFVEVTTFRQEFDYSDHRHPDRVAFVSDVKEDLTRRDFTVNAMAYSPKTGLLDYFGGQEDMERHLIRCVGDPKQRFEEDALRMLRAFRFAAKLHYTIEPNTLEAIHMHTKLIECVSVERVRSELVQIMRDDPFQIRNMTRLLSKWIPELEACLFCEQNTPWHHANVLDHTLEAISYLEPFDETLAYTLLIHDLAKPQCKTTKNGIDHFKGHPDVGANIAKRICRDFKLTKEQRKIIPLLVKFHDYRDQPIKMIRFLCIDQGWNQSRMEQLFEVKRCDILAHAKKGRDTLYLLERLKEVYADCLMYRPMTLAQLDISAKDLDVKGKAIGDYLHACLLYAFDHPDQNKKEILLERVKL